MHSGRIQESVPNSELYEAEAQQYSRAGSVNAQAVQPDRLSIETPCCCRQVPPMKTAVLLAIVSSFCLCWTSEAQNTTSLSNPLFNPVTLDGNADQNLPLVAQTATTPETGTYQPLQNQPLQPLQNQPLQAQPTPEQPPPANELLPSEKKNVIEAAAEKVWRLILTFGAGWFYDDNIFISHTNRKADNVFTLDGGFSFELGDYRQQVDNYLIAKFLTTGYLFTRNTGQDSVDYDAVVQGQYRFSNFTFQNQIIFDYLNGSDRTVGTFVSRYLLDGRLRLLYDVSDKTQLFGEFEQISSIYVKEISSYEYIGRFGVDYSITPKIKLGLEGDVGDIVQEDGPSSLYGQARLRAAYRYTEKLTFRGSVGFEVRSYSNSDLIRVTPVFELGADYHPFTDTTVSLTGFRKIFASPIAFNEFFTATGVELDVKQRLLQRFTAVATFGYEHDTYHSTGAGGVVTIDTGRTDDYFYIRPNITYDFRKWLTATLYYEYSRNSSSVGDASFYDNRVGLQISITF
jgi:Putative beta-barrel porin 2